MTQIKLSQLIKDKNQVDTKDITSAWTWLIFDQKNILLITIFGDLFLVGQQDEINWLDTGAGSLTKVANSVDEFQNLLKNKDNFENWFLSKLYLDLLQAGKILKQNEVYSYKILPVLGGQYDVNNIEMIDISVHFALSGQINQQIKDLPDGTKVKITTKQEDNE